MGTHTIIVGDCLEKLKEVVDNSIDLALTSPPYYIAKEYSGGKGDMGKNDDYKEYLSNMRKIIKEHFRILKAGSIFAWNTSPVISNGFRYMIPNDTHNIFIEEGFICAEMVQWVKPDGAGKLRCGGWCQNNGRPHTWHPNIIDETIGFYKKPGTPIKKKYEPLNKWYPTKIPKDLLTNIWKFNPETNIKTVGWHPAPFPEELPKRIILLYSYPNDIVLDSFMGSGTTLKVARDLGRNSIGIELSETYIEKAKEKIGFYQKSLIDKHKYEER